MLGRWLQGDRVIYRGVFTEAGRYGDGDEMRWCGGLANSRSVSDRHYIKKYNRYEKRHKNVPAHVSPAFKLNVGDNIIVGQCRPLSKTVRFNVLSVVSEAAGGKAFSKY